jgi:hypothetical protein
MTSKYICVFTITKYGISGNELPPPSVKTWSRAVLSNDGESKSAFETRMSIGGLALRGILERRDIKPYSCKDSISWTVYQIGDAMDVIADVVYGSDEDGRQK